MTELSAIQRSRQGPNAREGSTGGGPLPLAELSPRLAAVARFVLPGAPVADVGTDHAYLPVHLVGTGRVPRAVASDRMPGPLEAARRTVAAAGLADRVELRLGDGLQVLQPGEVATVVLAGMGGSLMARILGARPAVLASLRRLVLQPNTGEEGLRRWLAARGWRLADEGLVEDAGRIYVVMAAEPARPGEPAARPEAAGEAVARPEAGAPAEADFLLGPHLRRRGGELFRRHVAAELARARQALAGARRARRPDSEKLAALARRVKLLEEALRE